MGAWSLISFDVDEGKGKEKPRFGPDPVGYLIYSADARMAAVLAGTHRPALKSPDGGAESEKSRSEALLNFLAYAGRYEVRGDRVFHHVEVSVFTNLVGTTLERQFELEGRHVDDPDPTARDLERLERAGLETRGRVTGPPTQETSGAPGDPTRRCLSGCL